MGGRPPWPAFADKQAQQKTILRQGERFCYKKRELVIMKDGNHFLLSWTEESRQRLGFETPFVFSWHSPS
jgi:hypothetical protein